MDTISLYKHTRKHLLEFTEHYNKIKINNAKSTARIMKSYLAPIIIIIQSRNISDIKTREPCSLTHMVVVKKPSIYSLFSVAITKSLRVGQL